MTNQNLADDLNNNKQPDVALEASATPEASDDGAQLRAKKRASQLVKALGWNFRLRHACRRAKLTERNGRWFMVLELPSGKTPEAALPAGTTAKQAKALAEDSTVDLWNRSAAAVADGAVRTGECIRGVSVEVLAHVILRCHAIAH